MCRDQERGAKGGWVGGWEDDGGQQVHDNPKNSRGLGDEGQGTGTKPAGTCHARIACAISTPGKLPNRARPKCRCGVLLWSACCTPNKISCCLWSRQAGYSTPHLPWPPWGAMLSPILHSASAMKHEMEGSRKAVPVPFTCHAFSPGSVLFECYSLWVQDS